MNTAESLDPMTLSELLSGALFTDGDWVESKDQDPSGEVRLIQLADIGDGEFRDRSARFLTMEKAKTLRCTFLEPGDVLVARMPEPLGRACIFPGVNQPAVTVVDVCILRPDPGRVHSEWLASAINSPALRASMQLLVRGTTRQRISRKNLGTLSLTVPDTAAQVEIAKQLGLLRGLRLSASEHIARARRAVELYRHAILAAASSGRLTADWRDGHSATAFALLADLKAASQRSRRAAGEPDAALVEEAPDSWCKVTLGHLVNHIESGRSFNALGRAAGPDEWGVIKVSAMSWGRFLQSENKAIPSDRVVDPACEVKSGDLLISRANTAELVGATVLVDDTRPRLLLSDKSLRLVLHPGIDKRWLNYVLRSPLVRRQFSERATGTSDSMRNLSQPKILATTISLPPTEEQHEIANRVTDLMKIAEAVLRRLDTTARVVDRSGPAVLADAFCGELATSTTVGQR